LSFASDEFHFKRKLCLSNLCAPEHQRAFGLSTNYGSYTRGLTDSWGSNFLTCLKNEQSVKLISILPTKSNIRVWTERDLILRSKRNCRVGVPRERQLRRSQGLRGAGLDVGHRQPCWQLSGAGGPIRCVKRGCVSAARGPACPRWV